MEAVRDGVAAGLDWQRGVFSNEITGKSKPLGDGPSLP